MANSYLGRRARKEKGRKKRGRGRKERGQRGEKARLAATFQRVIIVISLGGLDSVVLSRETERASENDGNYGKDEG